MCQVKWKEVVVDHGEFELLIQRADELRGDEMFVLRSSRSPFKIWLRGRGDTNFVRSCFGSFREKLGSGGRS